MKIKAMTLARVYDFGASGLGGWLEPHTAPLRKPKGMPLRKWRKGGWKSAAADACNPLLAMQSAHRGGAVWTQDELRTCQHPGHRPKVGWLTRFS